MDSDDEDWEAIDMLVADRQTAQQASQPTAPRKEPLRPPAIRHRAVGPAALGEIVQDVSPVTGPACKHGVPLASCPRRAEHLTEIKESLLGIMTRLLDEPDLSAEENSRLSAERQRLQADQALLQAAPPLAGATAQRGEAAGAPSVPATPAHDQSQPAGMTAFLRKQSLSQSSHSGAQPPDCSRTGDAYAHQQGRMNGASAGYGGASQPFPAAMGVLGNCLKCGQPGHWARDCPNTQAAGSREGPLLGNCHACGEPGHWASACPQRGSAAGPASGGPGGGSGAGGFMHGDAGCDIAPGVERRPPDPALRGAGGDADAGPAGPCRWQEGTNDPQWSRRFLWTPVSC
jgi:hypothetical protein